MQFRFVESPIFTRRMLERLTPDEYFELQDYLLDNPTAGKMIQGTGGARKVRHGIEGRGKSGGIRVIYYLAVAHDVILLLNVYAKNEQSDLTAEQKKTLSRFIEGWLG